MTGPATGRNKSPAPHLQRGDMSATTRFKQLLMVTGLLTLFAVAAMAGLIAYLWWDSRDATLDVAE